MRRNVQETNQQLIAPERKHLLLDIVQTYVHCVVGDFKGETGDKVRVAIMCNKANIPQLGEDFHDVHFGAFTVYSCKLWSLQYGKSS